MKELTIKLRFDESNPYYKAYISDTLLAYARSMRTFPFLDEEETPLTWVDSGDEIGSWQVKTLE